MREHILQEIRRLVSKNGGKTPGSGEFEQETGIRKTEWKGKYWARWGDACAEAGFQRNERNKKTEQEILFRKLTEACRKYKGMPTRDEFPLYRKEVDPEFPTYTTFLKHFGSKAMMQQELHKWLAKHPEFEDVFTALPSDSKDTEETKPTFKEGYVYLLRWGKHYKIGRGDNIERRVKEIRVALPESGDLVHSIRTDDPAGIEAYWHRRFGDRRANGEWFSLTNADIAAFKRRKFQ